MKKICLLTLLVFSLAGCATTAPTPSGLAIDSAVTSEPLPIASETIQSSLAEPTAQPAIILSTNTPDARQQEQSSILSLVAPCNFAYQSISYSPSRAWVLVTCLGDNPEEAVITKMARLDGSRQWSLSFAETFIKPYQRTGVDKQKSFIPVRWTKDENFVYLAVQTSTVNMPYKGYDGLFRMDLSTGKSSPVLQPTVAPLVASYAFKFSPSGTKLAYINQSVQPITIVLYNLATGAENKITLDARFSQGGSLLWSPNEKRLLVSVFDAGKNGGNTLILYDLETMKNEFVFQQSSNVYLPFEWISPTTISAENYPGKWVYFDLVTKNIRSTHPPILIKTAQMLARRIAIPIVASSTSTLPVEITDTNGGIMRLVPAGEFVMGERAEDALSECQKFRDDCELKWFVDGAPPHIVYLDSYYMDVYEVTNKLYKSCVDAGVCTPPWDAGISPGHPSYGNSNYDNYPVVYVNWDQAQAYCAWRGARLPTEAEWEKAARGIDGRTYPWGEWIDASFANYGENFLDETPVGKYESGKSPYGMYDMAGNVSEWVADWYDKTYYQNSPARNPTGPDSGLLRVRRGGDFYGCGCAGVAVANRSAYVLTVGESNIGFRCARLP